MNREELIQQLREVIAAQTVCHPTISQAEVIFQTVFEKAQAPADEEREDMIAWLMRDHGDELSPLGRDYTDAEIADMLRRPAQTEPTDAQVVAARDELQRRGYAGASLFAMRAALKAAFTAGREEQS